MKKNTAARTSASARIPLFQCFQCLSLSLFLAVCVSCMGCAAADSGGRETAGGLESAGGRETARIENTDGTPMEIPLNPERIAAVFGPSYEALAALGAEEKIVVCADVQIENFPWAKKVFKRIAGLPYLQNVHAAVHTETLLQYRPDLAFTFARPNELRQFAAAGMGAVGVRGPQKLDDVKEILKMYANALQAEEYTVAALRYAEYFDEKRDMVKALTGALPADKRPKVYYAGIDLLTTYGKYSDLCELIADAGGLCVSAGLEAGNHTQVNFEQLAQWDPDYIFIDHGGMNDKASVEQILAGVHAEKRYTALRAVREGRVLLTPSGVFYWDMGLQKILLLMHMAKTLHPDLFAQLDMEAELQIFYREFFDYDLSKEEAAMILTRQEPAL